MRGARSTLEADSSARITAALAAASPGDVVRLAEGRFVLEDTLVLSSGVTLVGAGKDRTFLIHRHNGPAIIAREVEEVRVERLTVQSIAKDTPYRVAPDDKLVAPNRVPEDPKTVDLGLAWLDGPRDVEWGLVWVERSSDVVLLDIDLFGDTENIWLGGLYTRFSKNVCITSCNVGRFGRNGIALISSEHVQVKNCTIQSCANGLSAFPSHVSDGLGTGTTASVANSRFHHNISAGIEFLSSVGEELRDNECWENGSSGILLGLDRSNFDLPSRGHLHDNLCHHNARGGIVLASAVCEELRGNECWENGFAGIGMYLYNFELPSRGHLYDNRCHHNDGAGIEFSSSVGECRGNECWENGRSGILLEIDTNNVDLLSRGHLYDNRCHNNDVAGIEFHSSVGVECRGNECWENAVAGIMLAFCPRTPAVPSRGHLHSNRSHGNTIGYACTVDTEVTAIGNVSFRNEIPGTFIVSSPTVQHLLDWEFFDPGETPEQTTQTLRAIESSGPLAAILSEAGISNPDQLARYLCGNGGLGDLKRWLSLEADASRSEHGQTPSASETFILTSPAENAGPDGRRFRFARHVRQGLAATVWDLVAANVLKNRTGAYLVAATGRLEAEIEAVLAQAAVVNDIDANHAPIGNGPPRGLIQALGGYSGKRIGVPLILDSLARSETALAEDSPPTPFLEPAPSQGLALWGQRAAFVLQSPTIPLLAGTAFSVVFLAAVFMGWAKGYPDPFGNPIRAALHAVTMNATGIQLQDVITLLFGIASISWISGLFALINRGLPDHLGLHLPRRLGGEMAQRSRRHKPWRRWVRNRVYRADVGLVVLRNQYEWHADDIDALHDLLAMRPEGKSIIVLVEAPTRGILDRVVLRALKPSADQKAKAFDGVFACLGPEPGHLGEELPNKAPNIVRLLGVEDGTKPPQREILEATIRAEDFTLDDVIPMLALGSTHHFPFALRLSMARTFQGFGGDLMCQLEHFARMYAGDPDLTLADADRDRVLDWIETARRATAVLVTSRQEGRVTLYEVLGRSKTRADVAAALRTLFDDAQLDQAIWSDYVRAALRCGELYALEQIAVSLAPDADGIAHPNRALAALRSALHLARDHDRIVAPFTKADAYRTTKIHAARASALKAIDGIRTNEASSRFVLALLYAASLTLRSEEGSIVKEDASAGSARAAFECLLEEALATFDRLDKQLAAKMAEEMLRPVAAHMDNVDAEKLLKRVTQCAAGGKELTAFIDMASTAEDLRGIVRRHGAIAPHVVATMLSIAARLANTETRKISLAHTLSRAEGLDRVLDVDAKPRGVPAPETVDFEVVRAILAEGEQMFVGTEADASSVSLIDLMYGSTDSIFGTAKMVDRIEFVEPSGFR